MSQEGKCPRWADVMVGKCHGGQISGGKISGGLMSGGQITRRANVRGANDRGANVWGANVMEPAESSIQKFGNPKNNVGCFPEHDR